MSRLPNSCMVKEMLKVLPLDWDRLVLYGELDESSYEFFYYVKVDGCYIQCYDLPNVSEEDIDELFGALYAICIRNKDSDWSSFTLTVESSANFSIDYTYGEPDVDRDKWKAKYLV